MAAHSIKPFVALIALAALAVRAEDFKPTWDSLKTYQYPEWFRDAKFGIWAHWGPQSVPMAGDWYARNMYREGSGQYKHHLEHFGHPSTNGYKEIIALWKAEKWDPARLMALYKKTGAKYFVSMACHHDNFDLWNSKYHAWNAVNMGPKRDVVGEWQREAKKQGLYFGVSEHMGASFTWWQCSHGADKSGPMAGVPYDGADPKYADLYHPAAAAGDNAWYSTNPAWHQEWSNRVSDLIDQYHPDLLYTDGGLPFGDTGRGVVAHLYNLNGGKTVYACKKIGSGEFVEGTCVQDMERGVLPGISPLPWQTDTSIGDWFYHANRKYRKADWVIHMLVDIVSKNGNLLMNVVQRSDGTLDPEVETALAEVGAWMDTNGEAIYGTRPWLTYGEGPSKATGGHFKEDFVYSGADIRYTAKGGVLYAIALGWPGERVVLTSVRVKSAGPAASVKLLGRAEPVPYEVDGAGHLTIRPPALDEAARPGHYAFAFRIEGFDLELHEDAAMALADSMTLDASQAVLDGEGVKLEDKLGGRKNIGFWDAADTSAHWLVRIPAAGDYRFRAEYSSTAPSCIELQVEGRKASADLPSTGDWNRTAKADLGTLTFEAPGVRHVVLRPADAAKWKAINLWQVQVMRQSKAKVP